MLLGAIYSGDSALLLNNKNCKLISSLQIQYITTQTGAWERNKINMLLNVPVISITYRKEEKGGQEERK